MGAVLSLGLKHVLRNVATIESSSGPAFDDEAYHRSQRATILYRMDDLSIYGDCESSI
jgi:hypothetical protein